MAAVLVDTDVFSFVFKGDSRALPYTPHLVGAQICLSFQTVAELRLWALTRNWGKSRRDSLDSSLRRCAVLPFDDELTQRWAEVTNTRRRVGHPIGCGDAWIAATALRHICRS
jgi:tRNA(fMet)-specific endonuclease VapC